MSDPKPVTWQTVRADSWLAVSDPTQLRDRAIVTVDDLRCVWKPDQPSSASLVDAVFVVFAEEVEEIRSAYPEDVFPPLGEGWPNAPSRDRVSAAMARHVCDRLLSVLRPS